jgi:hypothetical protein
MEDDFLRASAGMCSGEDGQFPLGLWNAAITDQRRTLQCVWATSEPLKNKFTRRKDSGRLDYQIGGHCR